MIALLALACGAAPVAVPASEPTPVLNLTPADLSPLQTALQARLEGDSTPLSVHLDAGRYADLRIDLSDTSGVDISVQAAAGVFVAGPVVLRGRRVELDGISLTEEGRLTIEATATVQVRGLQLEGIYGAAVGAGDRARGSLVDLTGREIVLLDLQLRGCAMTQGSLLTLAAPRVEVDTLQIADCTAARALDLLGAQNVDLRGLAVDLGSTMALLRPQGTMALTLRQSDITLTTPSQLGLRAGMVKDEVTLHTRSP